MLTKGFWFALGLVCFLSLQPGALLAFLPPSLTAFWQAGAIATPAPPRLFLTPNQLNQIRVAIQVQGSHHQQAFQAIKNRVDGQNWQVYDRNQSDGNWNYARSWLARESALLYQVTGERSYAQLAYRQLRAVYDDNDPDNRILEAEYGLSRATVGLGFAIAYDWAASGWTREQQQWVRRRILTGLDAWVDYTHPNLAAPWGSNWVAVCRGGELVMLLSVNEEGNRPERFELLKAQLQAHLQVAYGPTGFTQEGNGYLAYSGSFLLPAVYALQSIGDRSLDASFEAIAFWQLALYGGAFGAEQQSLQFGVGGAGFDPEGWTSLLLGAVPEAALPYYQFFYDHHRGIANPAAPAQKFDYAKAGTTWALIYYPFTTPTDPDGTFAPLLADAVKGAYFFRNRWQDGQDTLISFLGDFDWHPQAWNQPEAFSLGLMAHGTRWIAGPGKQREPQYFSQLLVDEQTGSGKTGQRQRVEGTARGGYIVVDGGETYHSLGLESARRHVLVEFEPNGSTLMATLDQVQDESAHRYTWQLNVGDTQGDGGIQSRAGREAGMGIFLLQDRQGNTVKGWVVSPQDAVINPGDPLQIDTRGQTAKIWVVMWVGEGRAPIAHRTGQGMAARLTVAGVQFSYDALQDRLATYR